ncbi:MAG: LysM peptidoglycan-binding domain-containing protein, partial [Anaerolineales bacterium]|nr:LysM peptidoglycan-binding domain-containing protein [Anaerolineales bacterium]
MKTRSIYLVMVIVALLLFIPLGIARADATYVVQQGDTLSSIARQYGTTVQAIVQANNIENANFITVGQVLIIPGTSGDFDAASSDGGVSTDDNSSSGSGSGTAVVDSSGVYIIQPGDSLYSIAQRFGTTVDEIVAANNLANPNFIVSGQEIIVPGATTTAEVPVTDNTPAPTAPVTEETPPAPAPTSANLLPNPSFEGDWYFYLYNELQVPDGWQLAVDEGANTLEPGSGGLFLRPECRVVAKTQLPAFEHNLFVFNGEKTVKVFKGGAPTSFSLFTDVYLQPGTYRFTINYFPDTVAAYQQGGDKIWASQSLAAEVRIIHNDGGTGWSEPASIGSRNTLSYQFTMTEAGSVRLGGSFRNR